MSRDTEIFAASLWSALTPARPIGQALSGSAATDVLVVGGGFLGLSTALHLAESGTRVTVLEAQEPGFGASGRNTGFVVPSLKTALGPGDVARFLGERHAENLIRLVGESGNRVFALIRRLAIECSAEQTGWYQPAHNKEMAEKLSKRADEWLRYGAEVQLLSGGETEQRLGMRGYRNAIYVRSGGQINPLAYARGLAEAAVRQGVGLFHGARVTEIKREGARWVAITATGSVLADRVLLATNGMVGALNTAVATSVVPTRVHQIATQALSPALQADILPERAPVADTRRHTLAVRWSPDGRLLTGGLVMPGPDPLGRAARFFTRRLRHFFPQLPPLKADYVWSGVIAVTLDSLPRMISLAPGLDAAIGCNGRGIALTTALGKDIAALYSGRISPSDFALPITPPQPVPGRQLAQAGPHLYLPWSEFRDWMDTRAHGP